MKEVEMKEVKSESAPQVKGMTKVFSTTDLIGQTKAAAEESAKKAGYKTRLVHEDGQDFMTTMDINNKRLNLTVNKGLVTGVKLG